MNEPDEHLARLRGKNVIVTGGAGFIGTSLVNALIDDHDCHVTVIDNFLNSSRVRFREESDRLQLLSIDALDIDRYCEELQSVNYVFHLACVQIAASSANAEYDLRVNSLSTLRLLEHFKNTPSSNLERFVYTSSASVYGSSPLLPLREDACPIVQSNYAATKLLGENFTLLYGKSYGIPVTAVRYSNVYGEGQTPQNPYCGVLGKFIHNAVLGKSLPAIGDGEQTRDYTHVSDAVNATLLASVHPRAVNDVFNIGTGIETSVNELVKILTSLVDGITVTRLPERHIDNIRRRVVDIEKIRHRTGWAPTVGVACGIQATLKWYRRYADANRFLS